MDSRNRHSNESKEVLHYYLKEIHSIDCYDSVFVFIMNKGIGRNTVFVEGIAPETRGEFERLGFVLKDVFGPWDIIWAYHTIEHEKEPLKVLRSYYDMLNPGGNVFIAMPDPFFINFDNLYAWEHWLLREHHIMWDMDSFCEEAKKIGYAVTYKTRNTIVNVCKDMHIILTKNETNV